MSLVIRRAFASDAALIHEFVCRLADYEKLHHEVTASVEDFTAALFGNQPRAFCEIAERDREPCGMALWFYNFSTFHAKHGLYLEDLFVKPEERGRGVGKALMRHLAQICEREGLTRFQWSVLDWNEPAIKVYKSIGAVPLTEWAGFRLSGDALRRLAAS